MSLPVLARLPEVRAALDRKGAVVLVAEPGAGKTVGVPPALLEALPGGEVLVLEPRRLAARMAARFVAQRLGERVGERVGHRVRFDDATGPRTRLIYMTEGILARRLATDPELRGVAAVVFDEFHERHLHTDLGLALVRRLRSGPRPDLRAVVMSATLEAEPVARYLSCDVLEVPGRAHPVAIEHAAGPDDRPLPRRVAAACHRLLVGDGVDGDVLVFLPGAAEIRQAREACERVRDAAGVDLAVLHGDMPAVEQDRAVRPGPRRKIILSTNVAETSITLEGVVAVVDSGLARVARHSPWSGLPSLRTEPVSRASAAQRAGRAGRLRPGRCVRLYTKHDHDARPEHDDPEIRRADLTELVLTLAALGEDPGAFSFLEAPPAPALAHARTLAERLGAIDAAGAITPLGRQLLSLPLHPRLARLVVEARARGATERGCLLAALAAEREIQRALRARPQPGAAPAEVHEVGPSDLVARLEAFEAVEAGGLEERRIRAHGLDVAAVRAVDRARRQLTAMLGRSEWVPLEREEEALLLATLAAFPDRVGRRREPAGADVVFAGGGSGTLRPTSVVKEAPFLVAVEADDRRGGGAAIRLASAIEPEWLLELYPDRIAERRELAFDPEREQVVATAALTYDDLSLDVTRRPAEPGPEASRVLLDAALAAGFDAFCDADALLRWRRRSAFAADYGLAADPFDDGSLRAVLEELCAGATGFAELRAARPLDLVIARLDPKVRDRLERLAPEHVALPGRWRVPVRYEPGQAPWIASRLQDFFGLTEGPRVADGRVPLVLHLLAPNRRAVQVTTDLAGFWSRHYPAIRRELMRRYPKHAWPEDPLAP
ncbi:MAG: ATP-dependent helicase HrpB [Myxococcota bacterium]